MRGLGDTSDCGVNPCTWWDNLWMRDACLQYRTCVNPNDPMATLVTQGTIVGGAEVVGSTIGTAIGSGTQAAVQGLVGGGPTGAPVNWGTIAVIGIVGVLGVMLVMRLVK